MQTSRRFWWGAVAALVVGVPLAVGIRQGRSAPVEQEHEHAAAGRNLAPRAALTDNDSEVRVEAVYTLANRGRADDAPLLRSALHDDDAWVRQTILQTLAQESTRALAARGDWLVPDLVARLDDSDPTTRWFAAGALHKATGKPWRYSAKATPTDAAAAQKRWKDWWASVPHPALPTAAAVTPERTDAAPTVAIRTIDGNEIAPAKGGQVTVINFWGTWCAPCRQEVPDLQKLHALYKSRGVRVVGIALSETGGAAGLRAWCAKNAVTYPQALADDAVTEAYGGVHEVPLTVLVDAHGKVRYRWHGERDFASFQSAVERALKA